MTELGKVLLFEGETGRLRLVELPKPAIGETEVLVRVEAASICGSDLHSIHGKRKVPIPTILGHEIVGIVEAMGGRVNAQDILGRKIIPGDRITWSVVANCGSCQLCLQDIPQKCLHSVKYGHEALKEGSYWNGGFAQWCVLVAGTKMVKLPQSIPLEVACSTSCATATICAAIDAVGDVRGKNCFISGAGLLGLQAVARCLSLGAGKVYCSDRMENRLQLARAMGAETILTTNSGDLEKVKSVDVFVELSGATEAFDLVYPHLAIGAKVVLVGAVFPVPDNRFNMEHLIRRMITIRGVHNYAPMHLGMAVEFLEKFHEKYKLADLFGKWFKPVEHEQALELASSGRHHRVGFQF